MKDVAVICTSLQMLVVSHKVVQIDALFTSFTVFHGSDALV